MNEMKFSLDNLRRLMAASPAWKNLSPEQQENIEGYIKNNDKAMMLYVYQQLQEEADAHQLARDNLAHKVLTIKPTDSRAIQAAVYEIRQLSKKPARKEPPSVPPAL